MQRYTTDRPGLVAFYDIRPGNRAGLFSGVDLHRLPQSFGRRSEFAGNFYAVSFY